MQIKIANTGGSIDVEATDPSTEEVTKLVSVGVGQEVILTCANETSVGGISYGEVTAIEEAPADSEADASPEPGSGDGGAEDSGEQPE